MAFYSTLKHRYRVRILRCVPVLSLTALACGSAPLVDVPSPGPAVVAASRPAESRTQGLQHFLVSPGTSQGMNNNNRHKFSFLLQKIYFNGCCSASKKLISYEYFRHTFIKHSSKGMETG